MMHLRPTSKPKLRSNNSSARRKHENRHISSHNIISRHETESNNTGSVERQSQDSIGELNGRFEELRLHVHAVDRQKNRQSSRHNDDSDAEDDNSDNIKADKGFHAVKFGGKNSRPGFVRSAARGWGSNFKSKRSESMRVEHNCELPVNELLCYEGQSQMDQNRCSDDDHEMLSVLSGIKSTNTVILEAQSAKSASRFQRSLVVVGSLSGKENDNQKSNMEYTEGFDDTNQDEFEEPRARIPMKHAKSVKTSTNEFKAVPIFTQPSKVVNEKERNSGSSYNTLSEYLEPSRSRVSQMSVEVTKSEGLTEKLIQRELPTHNSRESLDSLKSLKHVASGSAAVYPECMLEFVVPVKIDVPIQVSATDFSPEKIKFHDSEQRKPKEMNATPANCGNFVPGNIFNEASGIHSSGEQSSFYSIKLSQKGGYASGTSSAAVRPPLRPQPSLNSRPPPPPAAPTSVSRNIFHDWNSEDCRSKQTAASLDGAVLLCGDGAVGQQEGRVGQPPVCEQEARRDTAERVKADRGRAFPAGIREDGLVAQAALLRCTAIFLGLSKVVADGVRRLMPRATDIGSDEDVVDQTMLSDRNQASKKRELAVASRGMLPSGMRFEEYSLEKLTKALWQKSGLAASVYPEKKKSLKDICVVARQAFGLKMIGEVFLSKSFEELRKGQYDSSLELILSQHGTKLQVGGEILTDGRILPAELLVLLLCACIKEKESGSQPSELDDGWCESMNQMLTKALWNTCKYLKLATSSKILSQLMNSCNQKVVNIQLDANLPRDCTPDKLQHACKPEKILSKAEDQYARMMERPKCETRLAILVYILTSCSKIYKNQLFLSQPTLTLKQTLNEITLKVYKNLRNSISSKSLHLLENPHPIPSARSLEALLPSKIASVLTQCHNSLSTQSLKLLQFGLQRQQRHKNLKKHYFATDGTVENLTKQENRIYQAYSYCHETLAEFLTKAPPASFETLELFVLTLFVLFRDLAQDREDLYAALWNSLAACWKAEICQRMLIVIEGKQKEEQSAQTQAIKMSEMPSNQNDKTKTAIHDKQPQFRDWLELTLDNNLSLGVSVADIWKFVSHHCKIRAPVEPFDVEVRKSNMDIVRECAISQMVHKLVCLGRV